MVWLGDYVCSLTVKVHCGEVSDGPGSHRAVGHDIVVEYEHVVDPAKLQRRF